MNDQPTEFQESVKLTDEERLRKAKRILHQAATSTHVQQIEILARELVAWVNFERAQARSTLGDQVEATIVEFSDQVPLVFTCIEQVIHGGGEKNV